MMPAIHDVPVCNLPSCGQRVEYDPVFAPDCGQQTGDPREHDECGSSVWHGHCLMEFRQHVQEVIAERRSMMAEALQHLSPQAIEMLKRMGIL